MRMYSTSLFVINVSSFVAASSGVFTSPRAVISFTFSAARSPKRDEICSFMAICASNEETDHNDWTSCGPKAEMYSFSDVVPENSSADSSHTPPASLSNWNRASARRR